MRNPSDKNHLKTRLVPSVFNVALFRINYIPSSIIVTDQTTLNITEHCFVLCMPIGQSAHFKNVSKRTSPVQIVCRVSEKAKKTKI